MRCRSNINLGRFWWSRAGSNRWPPRCERGALPTELRPHNICCLQLFSVPRLTRRDNDVGPFLCQDPLGSVLSVVRGGALLAHCLVWCQLLGILFYIFHCTLRSQPGERKSYDCCLQPANHSHYPLCLGPDHFCRAELVSSLQYTKYAE